MPAAAYQRRRGAQHHQAHRRRLGHHKGPDDEPLLVGGDGLAREAAHGAGRDHHLGEVQIGVLRGRDQETGPRHRIDGADEYQLMVEHFADAVLGRKALAYSPAESVANLRVLDALRRAARDRRTVRLEPLSALTPDDEG